MDQNTAYLLVNFGGPRHLQEIFPFLKTLLTDKDVIRTSWPNLLHNLLFTYIAKRRAKKIAPEYALIGGKSPIYEDTEALKELLGAATKQPCLTFHRYLPALHTQALEDIEKAPFENIVVLPLFPQFSFATTGSIARFFKENLKKPALDKLQWVSSYALHPKYIAVMQKNIADFLKAKGLEEKETILFFSAHGVPQPFVCMGDVYQK